MTTGSMTKAELVEEVSRVSDLTKKHSEVIVDTVFKSIIDALHRGEKIELRGFGSFRLRRREPRKGRNPKTGDKVDVPPKKVPYFKPGKELKELINREPDTSPHRSVRPRSIADLSDLAGVVDAWIISGAPGGLPTSPVRHSPEGCVFCSALTDPDGGGADRLSRPHLLRHPQPVSLQQRPPDGGPQPAHRDARVGDARGADAS